MKRVSAGLPSGPVVKNLPSNAGDVGSNPGQGARIPNALGQLSPPATTKSTHTPSLASLVAQMVKNLPAVQETRFNPWVGKSPWRREWLPTPVFLPGESRGQRSLVGYSPWGRKESDMPE